VIVGQRVCNPGPTFRWQQMARAERCALVYEVDDDLLDVDPSNGPAWSFFSRLEVADLVTVSTERLAEVMSKRNRNVIVLPNCVPQSLFDAPHAPGPRDSPSASQAGRRTSWFSRMRVTLSTSCRAGNAY
jgi:hypothetical protein